MDEILRERGVEFDVIRYLDEHLSRAVLEGLVDRLPGPPSDLVRKDKRFAELGFAEGDYESRSEVVDVLLAHPELMQRPVIVRGQRVVIARPAEKVLELLD